MRTILKPLQILFVALTLVSPRSFAATVSGARLPDGVEKVAENRYRTRQKFDDTMKFFRTAYPVASYPRRAIVNQPGIKAVHISNPSKKGFLGLNVYETNDEVRIYVVTDSTKKP